MSLCCLFVLQDDIPEMQEYFFINLTSVKLITYPLTSYPPRLGRNLTTFFHDFFIFLYQICTF